MSRLGPSLGVSALLCFSAFGCESLDRFDTKSGEAYCGPIVGAKFARTAEVEGGFNRLLQVRLEIDTDALTTVPGTLTSSDAATGPCAPAPTFKGAKLRATQEILHDSISMMEFEDGQVQNIMAWVDSTCRGPMLAVVSLYKNDRVELRLMKPAPPVAERLEGERDAFALFSLARRESGTCFP